MDVKRVLLVFLGICQISTSLKIFIFAPTFGYSHILFAGRIADVLVDGGHKVTILQPSFDPDVTQPGTEQAKTIFFTSKNIDYTQVMNMSSKTSNVFYPGRNTGADVVTLFKVKRQLCSDLLDEKDLIQTLKNENFDVGMTEFIDYCGDGFLETIGIQKQITLSAVTFFEPIYDTFGLPKLASFVPHLLLPFSDHMTWKQKLINLVVHYKIDQLYTEHMEAETEIYRGKVDKNMDDLLTLRKKKTAMAFINADENLEIPPFMTSKIKLIGGIKPRNVAPIPKSLIEKINQYKGFVLLSFGTFARASMVPQHIQDALMNTFENFPDYLFLWKHDIGDESSIKNSPAKNWIPMKWLPQYSLLHHPKCKAFINHAGFNGAIESVSAGVPMILVPLFGDQNHNAAALKRNGLGIFLGLANLTEVGLTEALKEMLQNTPSNYHIRAKEFSKRLNSKVVTPEFEVLKYTEYVAEFGTLPELNLASANMTFIEMYMLGLLGSLLFVVIFILVLVFLLFRLIFTKCFGGAKNKVD